MCAARLSPALCNTMDKGLATQDLTARLTELACWGYDAFHADSLSVDHCCFVYLRSPGRWCRAPGLAPPTPCLWDWTPTAYLGPLQSYAGRLSLTDDCALHHTLSLALRREDREMVSWMCVKIDRGSVWPHLMRHLKMSVALLCSSALKKKQRRLIVCVCSESSCLWGVLHDVLLKPGGNLLHSSCQTQEIIS